MKNGSKLVFITLFSMFFTLFFFVCFAMNVQLDFIIFKKAINSDMKLNLGIFYTLCVFLFFIYLFKFLHKIFIKKENIDIKMASKLIFIFSFFVFQSFIFALLKSTIGISVKSDIMPLLFNMIFIILVSGIFSFYLVKFFKEKLKIIQNIIKQ